MLIKIKPFPILGFEYKVSMSKLIRPAFVLFALVSSSAFGQVTLIKDINAKADSSFASYPEFITAINDIVVYAADDPVAGHELWRSDGTKAGTFLLKNINPTGDSNPTNPDDFFDGTPSTERTHFVTMGTQVFFVANDGTHGYELWVTNGTANGTVMVKDIFPGEDGSEPTWLTKVGSLVFFAASNGISGTELWRSDGTTNGTFIIKDIFSGESGSNPRALTAIGNKLVFTANDGFLGAEPWISDATSLGTKLIKDVVPNEGGSSPSDYVGVDGNFYFRVGSVIWKSDGTIGGTASVWGDPELELSYFPQAFIGDELYFTEYDFSLGVQSILKTDGTVPGTTYVFSFPSNPDITNYYNWLSVVDNDLFFGYSYEDRSQINNDPDLPLIAGIKIMKLNPVSGMFEDFLINEAFVYNPGAEYTSPIAYDFIKEGSSYFLVNTLVGAVSILKKEAGSGVTLYEPIATFAVEAVKSIVPSHGKFYFQGYSDSDDFELWASSGTFASTHVVKNTYAQASSDPRNFILFNNHLFFQAKDGSAINLWKTDGTTAGTTKVRPDVILEDKKMVVFNGALYFTASNGTETELWKTDGTSGNTVLVKQLLVAQIIPTSTTLFLYAYDDANGYELWKTDGTTNGTVLLKDIKSGTTSSLPANFTAFRDKLYFKADDGTSGSELWQSNGTPAGTIRLMDINPGTASSDPGDYNFAEHDGMLYFSANNGTEGIELWRTDGTPAGTQLFRDMIPGPLSSLASPQVSLGERLIFRAFNIGDPIAKLWTTTTSGTITTLLIHNKYVSDIKTDDHVTAYFSSENDLWKTGGIPSTTTRVADFPALSSVDVVIGVIDHKPYLSVNDEVHGTELWKSKGTQATTFMVDDIYDGIRSSNPSSPVKFQNSILFAAENGTLGRELWRYDLIPRLTVANNALAIEENDEVEFPLTDVGTSFPIELTLRNAGESALVFSSGAITIEGANASSFKINSFSTTQLAVEGTTALTVAFEPQDDGQLFATLKIQSSDPLNPTFTIMLRGVGNAITGIDDGNDPLVQIYPNPSTGIMHVKCPAVVSDVRMVDATGNEINVVVNYGNDETLIHADSQPGVYILQLQIRDIVVRKKVVILK
jgi:ELWxxDGT repeat protein